MMTPGDDLHGDAGGEPRHHRVGDEVHDRAELQQPEQQHHDADDQRECRDVRRVAGVQAGGGQHAARRQRERAGQRRHHQHGSGEHRTEHRRQHARIQSRNGIEAADAGVRHALRYREQSGDETGEHVTRSGRAEATQCNAHPGPFDWSVRHLDNIATR